MDTIPSVPASFTNNVGNSWNTAVTFALPTPGSPWVSGYWEVDFAATPPWFNPTSGVGVTLTGGLLAYLGEPTNGKYPFPVTAAQLSYLNAHASTTVNAGVTGHANGGPDFFSLTLNLIEDSGGGPPDTSGFEALDDSFDYIPGWGSQTL